MPYTSVLPNLYASDIERTASFYRDLLGAAETFRYPANGTPEHIELKLGAVTIALSTPGAAMAQGLPVPTDGHPLELVVWCDDTDEAVRTLRGAGTPVLIEPYTHAAGHRRAYVTDPDGNWIALVSRPST